MTRIPAPEATWKQRVYMLWVLTRIFLLAIKDPEDIPHNIDSLRNTWYAMGGQFEQKTHQQMRREVVLVIQKALRK